MPLLYLANRVVSIRINHACSSKATMMLRDDFSKVAVIVFSQVLAEHGSFDSCLLHGGQHLFHREKL